MYKEFSIYDIVEVLISQRRIGDAICECFKATYYFMLYE